MVQKQNRDDSSRVEKDKTMKNNNKKIDILKRPQRRQNGTMESRVTCGECEKGFSKCTNKPGYEGIWPSIYFCD